MPRDMFQVNEDLYTSRVCLLPRIYIHRIELIVEQLPLASLRQLSFSQTIDLHENSHLQR